MRGVEMKRLFVMSLVGSLFCVGSALAASTVKIGLAAPMTGPNANFGLQFKTGVDAAVRDLNAAGGIAGKKLEVVVGDDVCDPKQAVSVANYLVDQEKVVAVVGHYCSSSTIPATDVYDEADVLSISPGSTNPKVTERQLATNLRTCGRDDMQGAVAAQFMKKLGAKRVAIINDKDTYGVGIATETAKEAKKLGLKVVLEDGLTRGEKDYNALVTKIKAAKVDAVFFGGVYAEAGILVRQMRQQGLKQPFVSDDGIAVPAFVTTAGPEYLDNVYFTFMKDHSHDVVAQDVVARIRAEGKDPTGFALYAYAATQLIAESLKHQPGVTEGAALADWIKQHKVDTVLGALEFDQKGDPTVNDFVIYTWDKTGEYRLYK